MTRSSGPAALFALSFLLGAAIPAAAAGPPVAHPLVSEMPLPGGVAALLQAVDAPGVADPATAMLAFVRVAHAGRTTPPARLLSYIEGLLRGPVPAAEPVPLPLSAETWTSAILRHACTPDRLALAIFADQRASFVYYGLMSLDDETLAFLEAHRDVLSAIASRGAGAFAQWARAVHVRNGQLQIPGGPKSAAALWEPIVGQSPADSARFLRALFTRDAGRAAFFYDTVSHLDAAHQAFALGASAAGDAPERFTALYSLFARTATIDASGTWPLVRHPVNPGAVLARVLVTENGRLAPPASRRFWDAVFAGNPLACPHVQADAIEADAAWLAGRIEAQPAEKRGEWLGAVTFAQRVFGQGAAAGLPAACEATVSFPRHQALLLTLERTQFHDPADYVRAVRFADRLWTGLDRRAAVLRTAQAQGVLGIIERAVSARVIDAITARRLLASLVAVDGTQPGGIGSWMRHGLLPAVCAAGSQADHCLLHAVAGEGWPGGAGAVFKWEDQEYRVDLGAATLARLRRIRHAQKATAIDDALSLLAVAEDVTRPAGDAQASQRSIATLKALMAGPNLDLSEMFGHGVPRPRDALRGASERLAAGPDASARAEIASSLVDTGDQLLADALVSFAYAIAIGDADDAVLMAGDPSRQHRFDAVVGPATEAWHLPDEVQATDRSWLVEGSVLGLETLFAKSWLRRLSIHDPGMRPRPDSQDVRAFGESEAIFNAFDLDEAGRDGVVAALRRGRERWAKLLAVPDELWRAAAEVGVDEWRCRAALWAAERSMPPDYASLSELMWLGRPDVPRNLLDAWGVSARTLCAGLLPKMPSGQSWEDARGPRGVGLLPAFLADVHLRAAEMLAELRLPAVLAPGITSYVVWDVLTTAEMAHPDDWFALVRAVRRLPADRTFDYVSMLTAFGPLVPAR